MTTDRLTSFAKQLLSILCIFCISVALLFPVIQSCVNFDKQNIPITAESEWSKVPDSEDLLDTWFLLTENEHVTDNASSLKPGAFYAFRQLFSSRKVLVPPPRA